MSLRQIYGLEPLLNRLGGALASGRFPQAALFVGPPGVGKQRLALWAAQGMLCTQGPAAPCGRCGPCQRVTQLRHPDLHWFIPIPRPKAAEPDKQVEEARQGLAAVLEERRASGHWQPPDGMAWHSLASVRLLQRVVALTPFEGPCKVVLVGDAERLVVQEASPEAANALLKTLEEPPPDTTILLTAADPQALLPTIRSRLVPVRVPRVSDDVVRTYLRRELDPPLEDRALERRALLAEGCIGRALWAAQQPDGADRAADEFLAAVRRGPDAWLPRALAQMPWAARGDFSGMLDALAVRIRSTLEHEAGRDGGRVERSLAALRRIEAVRAEAQANANPQLALAVLGADLEQLL